MQGFELVDTGAILLAGVVGLRSSAAATRNSPGMVEIWGGELTLGPARVRRMGVRGHPP